MAIIKGSTPTIKVVLSRDEVDKDSIDKVYLTFAQAGAIVTGLNSEFAAPTSYDDKTLTYTRKLTQSETDALIADVDLDCQVDVVYSNEDHDRKISKIFSFGVCKSLRTGTLPNA